MTSALGQGWSKMVPLSSAAGFFEKMYGMRWSSEVELRNFSTIAFAIAPLLAAVVGGGAEGMGLMPMLGSATGGFGVGDSERIGARGALTLMAVCEGGGVVGLCLIVSGSPSSDSMLVGRLISSFRGSLDWVKLLPSRKRDKKKIPQPRAERIKTGMRARRKMFDLAGLRRAVMTFPGLVGVRFATAAGVGVGIAGSAGRAEGAGR